jgi:hypothetical protein
MLYAPLALPTQSSYAVGPAPAVHVKVVLEVVNVVPNVLGEDRTGNVGVPDSMKV